MRIKRLALGLLLSTVFGASAIAQYDLPPVVYGGPMGSSTGAGPGTTSLTVGTTPVQSGTTTRVLYDNAGILGEYTLTGTGTVVVMKTSPTLTTPVLGVATGTSLALGGCTIGTDALCITGTSTFGVNLTISAAGVLQTTGNIQTTGGNVLAGNGNAVGFTTRSVLTSGVDGVFTASNNNKTDFTRLNLGGTSSSFPGLGKSSASFVLAQGDGTIVTYASCTALTTNSSGVLGCTASDPRLKNIDSKPFAYGLKEVEQIVASKGVISFRGKPKNPENVDTRHQAGFNCAVVKKYLPLGTHDDKRGYCNLDPEAMQGALFNAVAALSLEVQQLRAAKGHK